MKQVCSQKEYSSVLDFPNLISLYTTCVIHRQIVVTTVLTFPCTEKRTKSLGADDQFCQNNIYIIQLYKVNEQL